MITLREVMRSLYGAGRLVRFDAAGLAYFPSDSDGARRSFFAAAIIAPLYVFYVYVQMRSGLIETPLARLVPLEGTAYVLSWVAYPLAIVAYGETLGCAHASILRYIAVYNWSNMLLNVLYLGIGVMVMRGGGLSVGGAVVVLSATGYMTGFLWFIAKNALGVSGIAAAGAVFIDFALGLLVQILSAYML